MACKSCERAEDYKNLDIESLIDEQLSMEVHLAKEQTIKDRMAICSTCPFFSDHTCTKCGCFSRFRASLPMKSCPVGYWLPEKQ